MHRAFLCSRAFSTATSGLFNKPQLQQPADWVKYAQETICRCQPIVEQAVTATASANTIQLLDDISDHLCQVYDGAEFCRNVHSVPEWRQQALQAVMVVAKYIQELNMHHGLYTAVVQSLQHYERLQSSSSATSSAGSSSSIEVSEAARAGYNPETVLVGRALQKDFEQRGVHLDSHGQSQALQMSEDIATLGMQITQNAADQSRLGTTQVHGGPWVDDIPAAWRSHMNSQLSMLGSKSKFRTGSVGNRTEQAVASQHVPLDQGSVGAVVRHTNDETVRRQVSMLSLRMLSILQTTGRLELTRSPSA